MLSEGSHMAEAPLCTSRDTLSPMGSGVGAVCRLWVQVHLLCEKSPRYMLEICTLCHLHAYTWKVSQSTTPVSRRL